MGVMVMIGAMALTSTFFEANSTASCLVIMSMAPLLAQ